MRKILIVGCLLILLSACTSVQALPDTSAGGSADERLAAQEQNGASVTEAPVLAQSQPSKAVVPVQNWNSEDQPEIQLVDLLTGERLKDSPTLAAAALTLAADGKKLAAVESDGRSCEAYAGGSACRGNASVLHLVDLSKWRDVTVDLSSKGWASTAAFSADSARLALSIIEKEKSTLMLFDTEKGERLAQTDLEIRPQLIRFNREGTELVIYGQAPGALPGLSQPAAPRVLRVEIPSLQVVWQQALEAVTSGEWCDEKYCQASHGERVQVAWGPAVVYAPEQHALYVVHADEERLTTVDFQAQQVRTVEIRKAQSLLERLLALTAGVAQAKGPMNGGIKEAVLSPDGRALYVVGRKFNTTPAQDGGLDFKEEFLGLQIVDPKNGQLIEQRDSQAANIRISPDGATLFLTGTTGNLGWTEVISTYDRKSFARLEGWEAVITRRVDGQPAYVAIQFGPQRTQLAVLDPNTLKVTKTWEPSGYMQWIPASP